MDKPVAGAAADAAGAPGPPVSHRFALSPAEWQVLCPAPSSQSATASRVFAKAVGAGPPADRERGADALDRAALLRSIDQPGRAVTQLQLAFARWGTPRAMGLRLVAACSLWNTMIGPLWAFNGGAFSSSHMAAGTAAIAVYAGGCVLAGLFLWIPGDVGIFAVPDLDTHPLAPLARYHQLRSRDPSSPLLVHEPDDPLCPCPAGSCAGSLPARASWMRLFSPLLTTGLELVSHLASHWTVFVTFAAATWATWWSALLAAAYMLAITLYSVPNGVLSGAQKPGAEPPLPAPTQGNPARSGRHAAAHGRGGPLRSSAYPRRRRNLRLAAHAARGLVARADRVPLPRQGDHIPPRRLLHRRRHRRQRRRGLVHPRLAPHHGPLPGGDVRRRRPLRRRAQRAAARAGGFARLGAGRVLAARIGAAAGGGAPRAAGPCGAAGAVFRRGRDGQVPGVPGHVRLCEGTGGHRHHDRVRPLDAGARGGGHVCLVDGLPGMNRRRLYPRFCGRGRVLFVRSADHGSSAPE